MALSLLVSKIFVLEPITFNKDSYVHWHDLVDYSQHLSGKDC